MTAFRGDPEGRFFVLIHLWHSKYNFACAYTFF